MTPPRFAGRGTRPRAHSASLALLGRLALLEANATDVLRSACGRLDLVHFHCANKTAHGQRVDFRSMDWKHWFGARPYPDAGHVATFWTGLRRKVVVPVAVP